MMTIKNYVRPQSLQEAYELNQSRRSRIIGGMLWLKMTRLSVNTAIDLCDLGLGTIEETPEQFTIGCMVSLRQLERHEGLAQYTGGALAKALEGIVGVQFRNTATVGGSIFGRFGFSDVLTMFLAMDCYVQLYKKGQIPLAEFAAMKPDRDILVSLVIKKTPGTFSYQAMRNTRTDLPTLTCAASRLGDQCRVVIGARPMKAMVVEDPDGILTGTLDEASAADFARHAASAVPTASNVRGSKAYRTHLVEVLTKRALLELGGQHGN